MPNNLRLGRDELRQIVGDKAKWIRAFEEMQDQSITILPDQVALLLTLATTAQTAAEAANGAADDARRAAQDAAVQFAGLPDYAQAIADVRSALTVPQEFETPQELQGLGYIASDCGYRGTPINSQSGAYTAIPADSGRTILHPNGAGAGDTFTIPSNANVPFDVGTEIRFVNMDPSNISIVITADTLYLSPGGATGIRTLAQYGQATARKVTATEWLIWGTGLT